MQGRHRGNARSSFSARAPFVTIMGERGPRIVFGALGIAEDAANGASMSGPLSVANVPADWGTTTFTVTYDPDNIAGISGGALDKNGTIDYEVAQSHVVGVTATPTGPYAPFEQRVTIPVVNVAPVLSNPTDTKTGQTTATITVDTTEDSGTLYWVVTTSGTAPTAAQIKAGKDNSGVTAAASGTQAISATGTKTVSVTGLTANTAYTAHFIHTEGTPGFLDSNVSSGNGFTTDGAGSTEFLQFLARITDPGATRKGYLSTLIDGLVADGLWAKIDFLQLYAQDISANALVNLKSSSFNASLVSAPTFTADQGFAGNGTSSYVNSGYNPSTAAGNYTQDSATVGVYVRTSRTSGQNWQEIGSNEGSNFVDVIPRWGDNNFYITLNGPLDETGTAGANVQGLSVLTRTASFTIKLYRNGTLDVSKPNNSGGIPNANFFVGARNNAGTADRFSTDQIAVAFAGSTFDATDMANMSSRLNAYMTSLGTNVY